MLLDDIDPEIILEAVAEGGRRARLAHKQAGLPIVVWEDGKVVHVPPEEIEVDEPEKP